jgi:parallel beta-helix repeat protein
MQISLVAYPASTKDNIISGTTYKVIKVRDEILTQDITLPKRNFGGKNNIPYYFEKYEIGTSASLEINPGVICKFGEQYWWNESGLYVNRGLKAIGGSTPDSIIVFTSITDDFYGGDSNADGHGGQIRWGGIRFADLSLDPLCELKNCYIRFADKGVSTYSSSPTIRNSNFNNNNYGIFLQGASNPVINNTDFSSNVYYGIKNEDKSFDVNATECWWGNNNGPIVTDDEVQNENEQELITSGVNYIPWKNLGAINPAMGDVSLNGLIQAYDASLILKHTVELISLNESQQQVADVSYNGEISALDASLVLQHVVGLENTFPVHKIKRANVETGSQPSIVAESMSIPENENDIEMPVHLYVPAKKLSSDIEIRYNPAHLRLNHIGKLLSNVTIESNFDNLLGKATIGIASATGFEGSLTPVSLHFDIIPETSTISQVSFAKFQLDEQDYLAMAQSGIITIARINSGTIDVDIHAPGIRSLYPNPVVNTGLLIYTTDKESHVEISLYNLMGQKVKSLLSTTLPAGNHNLQIRSDNLENGTYILKMRTDDNSYTHKVQIRK